MIDYQEKPPVNFASAEVISGRSGGSTEPGTNRSGIADLILLNPHPPGSGPGLDQEIWEGFDYSEQGIFRPEPQRSRHKVFA